MGGKIHRAEHSQHREVYFFIGTEAEFIKIFPVIVECRNKDMICNIIASGQNDIKKSRIWEILDDNVGYFELSKESDIKKNAKGLLAWFIKTYKKAPKLIGERFGILNGKLLVVHGDTVSTLMGAWVGYKLGMKVCHVEAGLRSHNIFNPFPEEIDRMLTSSKATMHFAPGDEPTSNLKKAKGMIVNTRYNTIIDSLSMSEDIELKNKDIYALHDIDYFVFVMHRQENLMNKTFFKECIRKVQKLAEKRHCVMILHEPTRVALEELNILEELQKDTDFTLLPRVDYFDFMKLLEGAKYVITDGGSNQEELSYMGKPTLIMRKTTERLDGIGKNARLYNGDTDNILKMDEAYKEMMRERVIPNTSPSKIIADELCKVIE